MPVQRSIFQKIKDFVFFPIRAITLIEKDHWGLSSLASERFDYSQSYVKGRCLDIGCGKWNRFVNEYLDGNGVGIDIYPYEGLTEANLVEDISHFPFEDASFSTATFIACINHVPELDRDVELEEAYRILKKNGVIIITMGNPIAEILAHKVVKIYDKLFNTKFDMDNERGMHEDEDYYLLDSEIVTRLIDAGFVRIKKKYFWTQWGLNHLFVAQKE